MASRDRSLDAVTFDYWGTLVWERPGELAGRRVEAWARILAAAGLVADRQALAEAGQAAWHAYEASWLANRQYLGTHAIHDVLVAVGVDAPARVRAELVGACAVIAREAGLNLADGIRDCLRQLREAGVRLGIVCDVGMTPSVALREHLDRQGLLELFDHWSFSDEVGWYKPAAEIFQHALAGLGDPDPARTAHIGDRRRTDVAGARGMGMVSVRYAGLYDDGEDLPEADHVITHHVELPAIVGVGRPRSGPGSG